MSRTTTCTLFEATLSVQYYSRLCPEKRLKTTACAGLRQDTHPSLSTPATQAFSVLGFLLLGDSSLSSIFLFFPPVCSSACSACLVL